MADPGFVRGDHGERGVRDYNVGLGQRCSGAESIIIPLHVVSLHRRSTAITVTCGFRYIFTRAFSVPVGPVQALTGCGFKK